MSGERDDREASGEGSDRSSTINESVPKISHSRFSWDRTWKAETTKPRKSIISCLVETDGDCGVGGIGGPQDGRLLGQRWGESEGVVQAVIGDGECQRAGVLLME